jgi:hypothetical protein
MEMLKASWQGQSFRNAIKGAEKFENFFNFG